MSYKLEIENKHVYLHARVTGQNSEENVKRYMEELVVECARSRCRCLLIEERLEGPRLDDRSVFNIASERSEKSRGALRAIAYVDVFAEGSSMENAEALATNRGMNARVLNSVAKAEQWLLESV